MASSALEAGSLLVDAGEAPASSRRQHDTAVQAKLHLNRASFRLRDHHHLVPAAATVAAAAAVVCLVAAALLRVGGGGDLTASAGGAASVSALARAKAALRRESAEGERLGQPRVLTRGADGLLTLRLEQGGPNFLDSRYRAEDIVHAWFGARDAEGKEIPGVGVEVTSKVKELLDKGVLVTPSVTTLGQDPAPGAQKTLRVTLKLRERGEARKEEKPDRTCYQMVAGLPGVQLGFHQAELGNHVGNMKYASLTDCGRWCNVIDQCRSFTACGAWNLCSFFDKVINTTANGVEVVQEGKGCQHYMEVPCDTPSIALSGKRILVRVRPTDEFDGGLYGADAIAYAWLGDHLSEWNIGPGIGKDVTEIVKQLVMEGKKISPTKYFFRDIAPNGEKVLLVQLYEDPGVVNWLTSDSSTSWDMQGWFCHDLVDGQNLDWCSDAGIQHGMEYRMDGGNGTCGDCWCCKRAVRAEHDMLEEPTQEHQARVDIFVAETRRPPGFYAVPGVPGKFVNNVGAGWRWHDGFAAKVEIYESLLKRYIQISPRKLVIIMDSDIGFGGCSDAELLERYKKIVSASRGATVVTGGDPWQNPPIKGLPEREMKLLPRREAVFRAFNLSLDAWAPYAKRQPPNNDYLFVNSGWIMGPAEDLYKVWQCAKLAGWREKHLFDDQKAMAECMVERPEQITIDYTGTLVTTMFGMEPSLFSVRDFKVHNRLADVTQCFIHTDCAKCQAAFSWPNWLQQLTRNFSMATA